MAEDRKLAIVDLGPRTRVWQHCRLTALGDHNYRCYKHGVEPYVARLRKT